MTQFLLKNVCLWCSLDPAGEGFLGAAFLLTTLVSVLDPILTDRRWVSLEFVVPASDRALRLLESPFLGSGISTFSSPGLIGIQTLVRVID